MKYCYLVLLALGLLGCPKSTATVDAGVEGVPDAGPAVVTQEASVGTLYATLPMDWERKSGDNMSQVYANKATQDLAILLSATCDKTYNECVLAALTSIKNSGLELNSGADVTINGSNFVEVLATNGVLNVWSWINYSPGHIRMFSCGGDKRNTTNEAVCKQIASTLRVIQ